MYETKISTFCFNEHKPKAAEFRKFTWWELRIHWTLKLIHIIPWQCEAILPSICNLTFMLYLIRSFGSLICYFLKQGCKYLHGFVSHETGAVKSCVMENIFVFHLPTLELCITSWDLRCWKLLRETQNFCMQPGNESFMKTCYNSNSAAVQEGEGCWLMCIALNSVSYVRSKINQNLTQECPVLKSSKNTTHLSI